MDKFRARINEEYLRAVKELPSTKRDPATPAFVEVKVEAEEVFSNYEMECNKIEVNSDEGDPGDYYVPQEYLGHSFPIEDEEEEDDEEEESTDDDNPPALEMAHRVVHTRAAGKRCPRPVKLDPDYEYGGRKKRGANSVKIPPKKTKGKPGPKARLYQVSKGPDRVVATRRKKERRGWSHECPTCNARLATQLDLEFHKLCHLHPTIEEASRRGVCSVCGRSYRGPVDLRFHVIGHFGVTVGEWICEYPGCNKFFRNQRTKLSHETVHWVNKVICPECSLEFASERNLHAHRRRSHGPLRCPHCARTFAHANYLERHVAGHTTGHGQVVHMCDFPGCREQFFRKTSLFKHRAGHVDFPIEVVKEEKKPRIKSSPMAKGSSTYPCDLCGKSYEYPECLLAHKRNDHKGAPVLLRSIK